MNKIILMFVLSFVFAYCGESEKEIPKSDYQIQKEKEKRFDTLNLIQAYNLARKNSAISDWDTAPGFTYQLQEKFENTSRLISFLGEIDDIVKKDSSFFLKIASSNFQAFKTFSAEISISPQTLETLEESMNKKKSRKGCFILNVTRIISSSPILSSDVESTGETPEDAISYLTYDDDETLIKIYGNLKDFYINY
jgi:hypothetical protein